MTTLIFESKLKKVITDYVDYPVLHITITAGIFSREFSVVLQASIAINIKYYRKSKTLINENGSITFFFVGPTKEKE